MIDGMLFLALGFDVSESTWLAPARPASTTMSAC